MKKAVKMLSILALSGFCTVLNADVSVTVYNDNFAVVRDTRPIKFDAGVNVLKFTDVASAIDPTSVSFKNLSGGEVRVLEQNYEYDLVSADSLLKRYVDKTVVVFVKGSGSKGGSRLAGKLQAYVGNNLIIEHSDGEMVIIDRSSVESISLESGPKDLVTKPTLVWLASASSSGTKSCEVTYTTSAINWKADYTVVLNEDDTKLDLSGWVTIDNRSGASYQDAKIKLIAGDVRRVTPAPAMAKSARGAVMSYAMAEDSSGFEEKSFMEYHMYTLGRPSTIGNNQTKQIEFVEPVKEVPCVKEFVYEVGRDYFYGDASRNGKVQIKIKFENKDANGLGIALPKGRVRTLKADLADGSLEFVGEDTIEHTPNNEKISLYIGNAFDLVVENVVKDQKNGNQWQRITREVTLKNRKKDEVVINVDQYVPRYNNWTVESCTLDGKSIDYKKIDAETFRVAVPVSADGEVKLVYIYTQNWGR